jgi:aminoglycoside/choline kinase family phosphotransferase
MQLLQAVTVMAPWAAMDDFLSTLGWAKARKIAITPDWSPRRTFRLTRGDGATAILVEAPTPVPGHDLNDFARLSNVLRGLGLSAPRVIGLAPGMMLTEDFGDTPIDTPAIERDGYETAVDALAVLRTGDTSGLTTYKDGYIYKKLSLFSSDPAWMAAWDKAEAALPPCPHVFSHMDYKAGNLMWLTEREGVQRVGLIDFQAAQNAPFVYDIVNLLEDARRNVPGKAAYKARFKAALPPQWQSIFNDWYAVISAQFHARVLGQVRSIAHAAPDVAPRLEAYLRKELEHPALAPVRPFFKF